MKINQLIFPVVFFSFCLAMPATSDAKPDNHDSVEQSGTPKEVTQDNDKQANAESNDTETEKAKVIPAGFLPNGEKIHECLSNTGSLKCIPGGPFVRGIDEDPHTKCNQASYNAKGVSNTTPATVIWLQTYYMDETEVTNKAYNTCVEEGKCPKSGPKYVDFSRERQPITGISWYEAKTFCEAQGKHLPTEAQWEKAARGEKGDLYPWGNAPATCDNAVIMDPKLGRSCGTKKRGKGPEKGRVLEVCSKGKSRYGLCDMIGNAEEWIADWYFANYEECGEGCKGVDPKGPCNGQEPCPKHRYKTVRGGSWYWPAEHATGIHRRSHVPSNVPGHHFGFRCAASHEEVVQILEKRDGKNAVR